MRPLFKLERRIGIDGEVKYILLMPLEAFDDDILLEKARNFMKVLNEWVKVHEANIANRKENR